MKLDQAEEEIVHAIDHYEAQGYREYNPDSAGTRRDECLVGDSRRQVLVDGDKDIEVVQE